MQTLIGKIEQLNSQPPHTSAKIKSLQEKMKAVSQPKSYYSLEQNQSAVIFTDYEEGVEVSLAVGMEDETEEPIPDGALMCIALMQRIEKDSKFLETVMELFESTEE